jgi:hypothetical protein
LRVPYRMDEHQASVQLVVRALALCLHFPVSHSSNLILA